MLVLKLNKFDFIKTKNPVETQVLLACLQNMQKRTVEQITTHADLSQKLCSHAFI